MAMWLIVLSSVAPCQCLTPGGVQMTSPSAMRCFSPPHSWTQPLPAVTMRVCPPGWVCQAVRAHGVKDTSAELNARTSLTSNSGLTLTSPVNVSAGPRPAGRDALGEISIAVPSLIARRGSARGVAAVDGQGDADDEAGAGTAQPQHGGGALLGLTPAVDGVIGAG